MKMKRLWEFGIPLIGGETLTMKQFDDLLKDSFVDPIVESISKSSDSIHILKRGLFDMYGKQIPIEEDTAWDTIWSKIPKDTKDAFTVTMYS